MFSGEYIFSQVMDHLPMHTFRKCVERYSGNRYVKSFNCFDQFLCMAFGQLTHRESLRDIEIFFRPIRPNSTTSESEEEYLVTHSRMLTKRVIGAFMLILLML